MNTSQLSNSKLADNELIQKAELLVTDERETLTAILHCLREIDRRRLFSALGYKSLFEMAVKRFNYSEDQAYRRIAAMRLLNELPEIEAKINSGELTLSHVRLANSLFRQEKKSGFREISRNEKLSIFDRISNTSIREAELITLSISSAPETLKPDRVQPVSPELVEYRFSASRLVLQKVELLKGRLAHKNPNISLGELFNDLCDLGLKMWDPAESQKLKKSAQSSLARNNGSQSKAELRRQIFRKSGGRCQRCGSSYAVEVDHIIARAKGGRDELENMRILCRSCNQRSAIEDFGLRKMDVFINQQTPSVNSKLHRSVDRTREL